MQDLVNTGAGTPLPDGAAIINANFAELVSTKQNALPAGTTADYLRGDLTFQALNKSAAGLPAVDNTSDADKPVSTLQAAAIALKESLANKATTFTTINNTLYPSVQAVFDYIATQISGLLNLRGGFDASSNLFPSTGGSGTAGAVKKGDLWFITVPGTLGGQPVVASDSVFANTDAPGQTAGNWTIMETNIGFVPENVANKDIDPTFAANSDTKYPSQKAVKTALASKGYTLVFGALSFNPADGVTYYYGGQVFLAPPSASSAPFRIRAFAAGVITKMNIVCNVTVSASAEAVTFRVRNVTAATQVDATTSASLAADFAAQYTFAGLAVAAGDEIEIQLTAPAWVTNPTVVGIRAELFVATA